MAADCIDHQFVAAPVGDDVRRQVCVLCGCERWESPTNITYRYEDEGMTHVSSLDPNLAVKVYRGR